MTNKQYEYVLQLARELSINLNRCPTCRQTQTEVAPGVWVWSPSFYKGYDDEIHDCDCEWQDTLRRHYLLAGIPMDYWTLSQQEFFGDATALVHTLDYLQRWDTVRDHGMGLQLYSATQGTGKTMLAALVAKQLINRKEHVYFTSFRDAIRIYDMPHEERKERVKLLRNTKTLVLDEVVPAISMAQSNFFATELEDLIRHRTGSNAVTIITTNLTPTELDAEYPRTFSLLAAKQERYEVNGMDARRSGDLDLLRMEMIANHWTRPIV